MEKESSMDRVRAISVTDCLHLMATLYRKMINSGELTPLAEQSTEYLALRMETMREVLSTGEDGTVDIMGERANAVDLMRGFRVLANWHPNEQAVQLYEALYNMACNAVSNKVGTDVGVDGEFVLPESIRRTEAIWLELIMHSTAKARNIRDKAGVRSMGGVVLAGSRGDIRARILTDFVTQGFAELAVLVEAIGSDGLVSRSKSTSG